MTRYVGHYAPRMLTTLVGLLIVLTLVPAAAAFVPWQALTLIMVATVGLTLSIFAHNRHLCERCVSGMPLDASAVAARYGLRFRAAHLFERKLLALGYLATVVGSAILSANPAGRYAWALSQASLVYLLLVYVTHQRLQPWCPYCGNGGEENTTPSTPSPLSTQI
ncbi:MAG TPA: hypothetical protein VJT31_36425 [Rugosimonospora sp.]|nr:hypothetical protein [Rugosimonospora sp.]